ncbi:hypothetical protein NX059_005459 [Plenodomus lindquistii]|nr:hypothetical protein NX059_005459 [Plenodomus lindquistii]
MMSTVETDPPSGPLMETDNLAPKGHFTFPYASVCSRDESEIRVITVLPARFDAGLRLTLSHFSLALLDNQQNNAFCADAGILFEALSYTWGTQRPDASILLDNQAFLVSPNLESILRHLRYEDRPRRIWIDAICINQANEHEKLSQLPLMHIIYARASRIVVWLGDASADSHLAMSYISEVYEPVEPGQADMVSDETPVSKWPMSFMATAPMDHSLLAKLTAFYKLLLRPWWYRAWIVQEMALADSIVIQCGKDIVEFAQLRVALFVTRKIHPAFVLYADIVEKAMTEDAALTDTWPADAINNALNLEYCRRMMVQKSATFDQQGVTMVNDVSWPLWFTRARLCREPHDRTFSILGMAGQDFRRALHYSYTASADEHDRNTVRAFVAATNSVDIILHSQHSFWLEDRSSWAPDWSQPERAAVFHLNGQSLQHPIAFEHGDADMPLQSTSLHIRGRIIGRIKHSCLEDDELVASGMELDATGVPVVTPVESTAKFKRRRRWWIFKKGYENGELFNAALASLPADDILWKNHLELFLREFERLHRVCMAPNDKVVGTDQNAYSLSMVKRFQGLETFFDLLEYLLMSRTICSMDDGSLLVAPDVAHVGDIAAVLAGCTNAVVLRASESNGSYRFLGDAHVRGITDEETSREGLSLISIN